MKIFLACSKHFYHKIPKIKEVLEQQRHKITLPNSYDDPFKEERMKTLGKEEHIKFKQKMMKLHAPKIKINDAILVLNFNKKNIPNYVGGGTFIEVIKAWELNKKIFFYNSLPRCAFTDELMAINPTIINGNLSLIK